MLRIVKLRTTKSSQPICDDSSVTCISSKTTEAPEGNVNKVVTLQRLSWLSAVFLYTLHHPRQNAVKPPSVDTPPPHTHARTHARTHTHTHPFNGPLSRTTRVSRYLKGKTNLDFTEARDSEWQWHQLGICKSAPCSTQITMPAPHRFLQARCPSCRPTNSVKALKAPLKWITRVNNNIIINILYSAIRSKLQRW